MATNLTRKTFLVVALVGTFLALDESAVQSRGRGQSRTVYLCDNNWQNCKEVIRPPSKNYFDLTWIFVLIGGGTWAFRNQQAIKDFLAKHQQSPKAQTKQVSTQVSTTKKPTKKLPPLPDPLAKSEWYVRRNGNAEGPYTREQLRDVQHITARTSVKREGQEQEDWVKAGSIEELASFLTN